MSALLKRLFDHETVNDNVVDDDVIQEKLYILAANTAAKEFTYGDVIKWSWIEDQLDLVDPLTALTEDFDIDELRKNIKNYNFERMHSISGFSTHLLEEHLMHLTSVTGVGYKITMPKQQTDVAVSNMKKTIAKEVKRASSILININETMLSNEEIRKRDDAHGRLAGIAAFSRKRGE